MSRVFIARDVALDRDVVVKVLSEESTTGVSGDRFRREIQLIARLQHPHIVSIHSAGAADGTLFYVMPFIGGESVRARLTREGPLPIAEARPMLERLERLVPDHADTRFHIATVDNSLATPSEAQKSLENAARAADGTWKKMLSWFHLDGVLWIAQLHT
jgi:serine/threonine-protein kinase